MKIIQEFRLFVQRGNVVDMAVGVIMGAAFGKIVNSVVADIFMPPIGYLIGGVQFTGLKLTLPAIHIQVPDPAQLGKFFDKELEPATINYGQFLQTSFEFFITAICIFLLVKGMNSLSRRIDLPPLPSPPHVETPTEKLLAEIRDLLRASSVPSPGESSPEKT